jgi:hypothetical protein
MQECFIRAIFYMNIIPKVYVFDGSFFKLKVKSKSLKKSLSKTSENIHTAVNL